MKRTTIVDQAMALIFILGVSIAVGDPPSAPGSLDPTFFQQKQEATPKTSKSPISGTERPVSTKSLDYTEEEYEAWKDACEAKKSQIDNPKAFQDCFKQKRKEKKEELRRGAENVEQKLSEPKTPPLRELLPKRSEEVDE